MRCDTLGCGADARVLLALPFAVSRRESVECAAPGAGSEGSAAASHVFVPVSLTHQLNLRQVDAAVMGPQQRPDDNRNQLSVDEKDGETSVQTNARQPDRPQLAPNPPPASAARPGDTTETASIRKRMENMYYFFFIESFSNCASLHRVFQLPVFSRHAWVTG